MVIYKMITKPIHTEGSGFRVWTLGFRIKSLGFCVVPKASPYVGIDARFRHTALDPHYDQLGVISQCLQFQVWGLGFRGQGLGFLGFRYHLSVSLEFQV
jgi:hypothetical protein